jgi:hypothetical protein
LVAVWCSGPFGLPETVLKQSCDQYTVTTEPKKPTTMEAMSDFLKGSIYLPNFNNSGERMKRQFPKIQVRQ